MSKLKKQAHSEEVESYFDALLKAKLHADSQTLPLDVPVTPVSSTQYLGPHAEEEEV